MVEQHLRSLGLHIRAPYRPPGGEPDVRQPTGFPPPAREGWEPFLVAQKRVGDTWPSDARNRILAARHCYEAGTHEMVTLTTPSGWTQLYCRPRRVKAPPRDYFSSAGAL